MNELTFPILKLLSNGKFHSGETIAQQLKVSRSTVWNALTDAKKLGIEIFSVRGRGYKLPQPVTLLDVQSVLMALDTQSNLFELEIHDYLESTNSYLMKKLSMNQVHASCVAANLQTNGRGRRGRSWQAGFGASLTFSVLWQFQCGAGKLSGLSLAVGISLIRALHSFGITKAQLKWPNDVLIDQEKLAGILIEIQGDMEGPSVAVIGIGINLNLPASIKHQIDQPVTDLASITQSQINPNVLLAEILKHLTNLLIQFEQQSFVSLRDEWTQYHAYHQKVVKMLHPDGRETVGTVINVADDGNLLVNTISGELRFSSGEISLRTS